MDISCDFKNLKLKNYFCPKQQYCSENIFTFAFPILTASCFSKRSVCFNNVECAWSSPLRMEHTEAAFLLQIVFAQQG